MIETKEIVENVILVAVCTGDNDDTMKSLDELEELAATAGAVTVDRIVQNREKIHPGTYLGKGKIDELEAAIYQHGATGADGKSVGCPECQGYGQNSFNSGYFCSKSYVR